MIAKLEKISLLTTLLLILLSNSTWAGTTYRYDDLHRLSRVERTDGSVTIYHYDDLGNRTSKMTTTNDTVTALFDATPISGPAPLTVIFTDQSIGNITSWEWDFDSDENPDSALSSPSYTYTSSGTYTAKLTVTGPGGTDTTTENIIVEDPIPVGPVLSVTPMSRDLPFTAGSATFQVANLGMPGTMNWTASTSTSWLTITGGDSGLDSGTITVDYEANSGNTRTGTLTVAALDADGSPATVTISQEENFTSTALVLPGYDLSFANEYTGENVCYALDLTRCQGISVVLNAHLTSGYLDYGLYDSFGNRLASCGDSQIEDGEYGCLNFTPTLSGTYYLRIFGSPDAGGTFDLAVYDAWFNAGVTDGDRNFYATLYTARFLDNGTFPLSLYGSDFFRFAAESGDQVAISLAAHINQGSLDINLLDRYGNLLTVCDDIYDESQMISHTALISRTITLDGNYYIKIDRNNGAAGNYDLNVNPEITVNSDFDGDGLADAAEYHYGTALDAVDTDADGVSDYTEVAQGRDPLHDYPVVAAENAISLATAATIPALDMSFTAELPADAAASYYAINLAAGQEIAVSLVPRINVGNLDLSLLDHGGATIAAIDNIYGAADCVVTGTNQLQRGVITATIPLDGDYYVKIDHDDGAYGSVDLGVYNGWANAGTTDCDRDFYSTSNTARFLYHSGNYPLSGYDSDFFRFSAESGDQVVFGLTPYINVGSLDISLLDHDGNTVDVSSEIYGDMMVISNTITLGGDYYVKINRHGNAYGNYDLLTTGINADADADGMSDDWEMYYFCYLGRDGNGDRDGDGLIDKIEYELSTNPLSGDTDGDQMPDAWEVSYHLNPLVDDAGDDQDFDTLSNYDEYDTDCDPNNPDTDNDQMIDGWEVMNDLNPLVDDAWEDPDHDGHSNFGEYLSNSSPHDSLDVPPIKVDFDVDLDADGVDLLDIILELGATDCTPGDPCAGDLDGDGDVDNIDLMLFAEDFGRVEETPQ